MPWRAYLNSRQQAITATKNSDKLTEFIAILLSCYFSILKALNRT